MTTNASAQVQAGWRKPLFLSQLTILLALLLWLAPTVSAQLPDLYISSGPPAVAPSQVDPGGQVSLSSWTVRNGGNAYAGAFRNGFYLSTNAVISTSDVLLGTNSNSGLHPLQSFTWGGPTLTIPANTTPGIYYIGILVDREDAVTESAESNNYVATHIHVVGCADLEVSNFQLLNGTTLRRGESIGDRIRASARNSGNAPADSTFVGFYLSQNATITPSDRLLIGGREFIERLDPGETESITIYENMRVPDDYPTGTAYLGIMVDEQYDEAECNENNNTRAIQVTIANPAADLYISSGAPTLTPSSVAPGEPVTFSDWTVTNQGGTATGYFRNGFYLSTDAQITPGDRLLGWNSNSNLDPGASFNRGGPTLTMPADLTPGTYYLGILTDREGAVAESNESNNYVSTRITITGCPDITVSSFTLSGGTTLQRGEPMGHRMTAIARNIGSLAADSITVGFYLSSNASISTSDRLLVGGREGVAYLDPGESESVQIFSGMRVPDDYPLGEVYLGVLVDELDRHTECDETNNYRVIRVTIVAGQADLMISTTPFECTPQTVQAGDFVTLPGYRIENQGTEGAGGIRNGFYFSPDSLITTSDTYLTDNYNSFIPAGGFFDWGGPTLRVPFGTAPGVYYMGILVDMENAVPESDESNNYICARVVVEIATDVHEEDAGMVPNRFELAQNYPNPFNPSTTIKFSLPTGSRTRLLVYNVLGQVINTLVDVPLAAGTYTVEWDGGTDRGTMAATGVYFYRLDTELFTETRKMVFVK